MKKILTPLFAISIVGMAYSAPDTARLANGKDLYNGAGSCVACHMADGKGQPGSVPPLREAIGWIIQIVRCNCSARDGWAS